MQKRVKNIIKKFIVLGTITTILSIQISNSMVYAKDRDTTEIKSTKQIVSQSRNLDEELNKNGTFDSVIPFSRILDIQGSKLLIENELENAIQLVENGKIKRTYSEDAFSVSRIYNFNNGYGQIRTELSLATELWNENEYLLFDFETESFTSKKLDDARLRLNTIKKDIINKLKLNEEDYDYISISDGTINDSYISYNIWKNGDYNTIKLSSGIYKEGKIILNSENEEFNLINEQKDVAYIVKSIKGKEIENGRYNYDYEIIKINGNNLVSIGNLDSSIEFDSEYLSIKMSDDARYISMYGKLYEVSNSTINKIFEATKHEDGLYDICQINLQSENPLIINSPLVKEEEEEGMVYYTYPEIKVLEYINGKLEEKISFKIDEFMIGYMETDSFNPIIYNENGLIIEHEEFMDFSPNAHHIYIINELKNRNGWIYQNEKWYYYNQNGEMATGWILDNGTWYYLNGSGAMETGWINENGTWYYLNGSGAMETGWLNLNGAWYYLDGSGAMETGWLNLNGTWYYLDSSGAMVTGWKLVNRTWYYMYSSGQMATNTIIDGWKIDASGAATPIN